VSCKEMTNTLEWRQSLHLEGRQWFQRFDNMFTVLQSRANSRRLSLHRDDSKIEQDLVNLETTQEYMAGAGVKRYCTKTIEDPRKELDGEGKASLKRSPDGPQCDVHAACMDWAGNQWKLNGGYRQGCGTEEE
jgi:hypothetical protein